MTDRDHFAAAALTGFASQLRYGSVFNLTLTAKQCYELADAMLRERERTNHDAAPAAIVPEPEPEAARRRPAGGTGDTPEIAAYARFVGEVMNWISEATGFMHDDVLRTDDARDIITDACSRCWDAFDRIAPTDHGAAPAARASVGRPRTDNADLPTCAGTGDTQEPVAWGVAGHKGLLYATSISRMDAVDMQSDYAYHTEIVPLYRSPPVTEPMPKEKRAEVSDRPKPITVPDPDSRVWETHTPATHATQGEGSEQREGTEPVAWAVACDYGDYGVALFSDEASAQTEADRRALVGLRPGYVVVPLYRHPPCQDFSQKNLTLTAQERPKEE